MVITVALSPDGPSVRAGMIHQKMPTSPSQKPLRKSAIHSVRDRALRCASRT